MKIKSGFMLRNIADSWIVVPIGERVVDFNGLITLNETGVFLWKKIEVHGNEKKLADDLFEEYEIDKETAKTDAAKFTDSLITNGIAEN